MPPAGPSISNASPATGGSEAGLAEAPRPESNPAAPNGRGAKDATTKPSSPGGKGGGGTANEPSDPRERSKVPDPANADFSITKWLDDNGNEVRAGLELIRPAGPWGMVAGGLADAINLLQDMDQVRKADKDSPFTLGTVFVRDGVNAIANFLGSLAALGEEAEDAATAGGVTAVADAVITPADELIIFARGYFDIVRAFLDMIVMAEATYNMTHAATPDSAKAWGELLAGYESNTLGDMLTLVVDTIDFWTLGFSNGGTVQQIVNWFKKLSPFKAYLVNYLRALWGIYGGSLILGAADSEGTVARSVKTDDGRNALEPTGAPAGASGPGIQRVAGLDGQEPDASSMADAAARSAASVVIQGQLAQARTVYETADGMFDGMRATLNEGMALSRQRMTELLGQDPMPLMVNAISEGLNRMNAEVSSLTQMGVLASSVNERSAAIIQGANEMLAGLDKIRVPSFTVPKEGSGGVLDAATELLQKQVIDRVMARITGMVEETKDKGRRPIITVKAHAEDIAEFSKILQDTATEQVAKLQGMIQRFSDGLAKCNSVEDIVNLLVRRIAAELDLGEGFTIDDIVQEWKSIGPLLDQADQWAISLANPGPTRHPAAEGLEPEAAPLAAAAAEPPEE